jgi:hypothetical protein
MAERTASANDGDGDSSASASSALVHRGDRFSAAEVLMYIDMMSRHMGGDERALLHQQLAERVCARVFFRCPSVSFGVLLLVLSSAPTSYAHFSLGIWRISHFPSAVCQGARIARFGFLAAVIGVRARARHCHWRCLDRIQVGIIARAAAAAAAAIAATVRVADPVAARTRGAVHFDRRRIAALWVSQHAAVRLTSAAGARVLGALLAQRTQTKRVVVGRGHSGAVVRVLLLVRIVCCLVVDGQVGRWFGPGPRRGYEWSVRSVSASAIASFCLVALLYSDFPLHAIHQPLFAVAFFAAQTTIRVRPNAATRVCRRPRPPPRRPRLPPKRSWILCNASIAPRSKTLNINSSSRAASACPRPFRHPHRSPRHSALPPDDRQLAGRLRLRPLLLVLLLLPLRPHRLRPRPLAKRKSALPPSCFEMRVV